MPAIASNRAKQASFTARQRAEREAAAKARQAKEAAAQRAFKSLKEAVAKKFGADPETLVMHMCRRGRREQI